MHTYVNTFMSTRTHTCHNSEQYQPPLPYCTPCQRTAGQRHTLLLSLFQLHFLGLAWLCNSGNDSKDNFHDKNFKHTDHSDKTQELQLLGNHTQDKNDYYTLDKRLEIISNKHELSQNRLFSRESHAKQ